TGLQIAQFTSIGVVPSTLVAPGAQSLRYWGGTQDNGTLRKSVNSGTWFDMTSGDGGQVVVDQTDHSSCGGFGACFVYGTFFGIGGGTGVYTGSDDGLVFFSPDAMVSDNPTWTRLDLHSQGAGDKHSLPARPVAWIAVDRSNNRVAYLGYNGFNAATPHQPGHVFKTADAGQSWTDISGNLPDSPVNSLTIDPSF